MKELDVENGFSVHDHRDGLKLLEQGRTRMRLENRSGYACPVCGDAFDQLLVTDDGEASFSRAPPNPLCVLATDGQLLVLTH